MNDLISIANINVTDVSIPERREQVREALETVADMKSKVNLALCQLFHEAKEGEYHKHWGEYKSFEDFAYKTFNYSSSTVKKSILVYRVFVLEHNVDPERLSRIGWYSLSLVATLVNEDNLEKMLELCESHSAPELAKIVKDMRSPVKSDSDPNDRVRLKFSVTNIQSETIEAALDTVSEIMEIDDNPGYALEIICAEYLTGSVSENSNAELEKCVDALENAFNVKLNVEVPEFIDG